MSILPPGHAPPHSPLSVETYDRMRMSPIAVPLRSPDNPGTVRRSLHPTRGGAIILLAIYHLITRRSGRVTDTR